MVVDIGGGTTEVAVISLGGVVALEAVRVGSFDIDAAIQALRAPRVRHRDRRAHGGGDQARDRLGVPDRRRVQGRGARPRPHDRACRRRSCSCPKRCASAIEEQLRAICDAVIACLARTPPELAQDLILNGVHLVGGGGMLARPRPAHQRGDRSPGAPRRRAARVRRARRRPLPRELRQPQGHVHGPVGSATTVESGYCPRRDRSRRSSRRRSIRSPGTTRSISAAVSSPRASR